MSDLLARLSELYPDFAARFAGQDLGRDHPYRVFVNHQEIPANAFADRTLADHDVVHIVIPVAGGQSVQASNLYTGASTTRTGSPSSQAILCNCSTVSGAK
ncbi:MAG: MoaD/ThiS family protein [Chloroflexi bacterium]|nr:MoaD/ThiS family protein [Chloroflexota bacterium]